MNLPFRIYHLANFVSSCNPYIKLILNCNIAYLGREGRHTRDLRDLI